MPPRSRLDGARQLRRRDRAGGLRGLDAASRPALRRGRQHRVAGGVPRQERDTPRRAPSVSRESRRVRRPQRWRFGGSIFAVLLAPARPPCGWRGLRNLGADQVCPRSATTWPRRGLIFMRGKGAVSSGVARRAMQPHPGRPLRPVNTFIREKFPIRRKDLNLLIGDGSIGFEVRFFGEGLLRNSMPQL